MIIYPAIDLRGGKCVRLRQGLPDQQTVYSTDPVAVAAEFKAAGAAWIHVVDLDGAFSGEAGNLAALAGIAALGLNVQFGGGLRTVAAVERVFGLGVGRAVIGTRAAQSAEFVAELVASFGERIAVGIDAKDGQVAVKGWADTTGIKTLTLARQMEQLGVATLIHTDIGTDGMLTGPSFAGQEELLAAVRCRIIASGGVSRTEDVTQLVALARRYVHLDGVMVGKALYEKRVRLAELLALVR